MMGGEVFNIDPIDSANHNFDSFEKYVDNLLLKMENEADEIPKWLTSIKKRIDSIVICKESTNLLDNQSVFEITELESFATSNSIVLENKNHNQGRKKLSLISEEAVSQLGCGDNKENSPSHDCVVDIKLTLPQAVANADQSENLHIDTISPKNISLPKPDKVMEKKSLQVKNIKQFPKRKINVEENVTPLKVKYNSKKNIRNKIISSEKSKRNFHQMSKHVTFTSVCNVSDNADTLSSGGSKSTPIKGSFRGKMAKCEMLQHQKMEQVKAKQEELKAKTINRIMANKERRMKAEEERLKKYQYEELRKQVAREKIAELNKNNKQNRKATTRQLTPITFKTHSVINPTRLYEKKDTSNLCSLPPKKDARHPPHTILETIQDITVDETTFENDIFNSQTVLNNNSKSIDKPNVERFAAIASTPFNNGQQCIKHSIDKIDAIFVEKKANISPFKSLNFDNKINFSSTLPVPDETPVATNEASDIKNSNNSGEIEAKKTSTFILEKNNSCSESNSSHQYEMTMVDSNVASDDNDEYYVQCSDSNKPIPEWARSEKIWSTITQQIKDNKLCAENIFGPIPRVNMNEIFKNTNRDFIHRNSSGIWNDSVDMN